MFRWPEGSLTVQYYNLLVDYQVVNWQYLTSCSAYVFCLVMFIPVSSGPGGFRTGNILYARPRLTVFSPVSWYVFSTCVSGLDWQCSALHPVLCEAIGPRIPILFPAVCETNIDHNQPFFKVCESMTGPIQPYCTSSMCEMSSEV